MNPLHNMRKVSPHGEHVLVIEDTQILETPKHMVSNIDEKEVVDEVFEIEVVNKENNIIVVEHIDFLGVDNLLKAATSSKYHILSRLLPKVLVMDLKVCCFQVLREINSLCVDS